jgi:hypothetical protein
MGNVDIGEVKILSWQDNGQNLAVKALTEILLPTLQGKNVAISVPHQNLMEPQETEDFQIFIWSSRSGDRKIKPPYKIWGYDVACRDEAFPGTGMGTAIVDESTGYVVAELFDDKVLYVHHDILHYGADAEYKIFCHLLQVVIEEISSKDPEEKLAREKKRAEEIKNASREAFVKACSGRFDKLLSGTQKTIEEGHKTIQKLQIDLTTKVREVKGAEQKLVQLAKARPEAEDGYRKEFEKFLTIQDVKKIEAGDGVIRVFTNMIFIKHEGVKYQIGEFRIEIFINGGIKFFNLTNGGKGPGATNPSGFNGNTSYNRHHPHVQGDGTPCLGTISSAVPQLIGEYQYSVVAILAIQYLKSVNAEDSAGQGIYWWPKAE